MKAGKKLIGAIIAIVAVVGVILIASGSLAKGMHKTFDSPKKYFAYVEKQTLLSKKDNVLRNVYENLNETVTKEDTALEEQITLTIGDEGQSYLRLLKDLGADLSWLNSAGIKYYVNTKDNDVEFTTTLYLNEKEILNPSFILDSQKKAVYAKIPELTKDIAKYDLEEFSEQFDEIFTKLEKFRKAYPDTKEIDKLFSKYVKLVLGCVENVEKEKEDFECDEVTQKCTKLKVTLKDKDLQNIVKTVCKEASKDKDLKKLFEELCKSLEIEEYEEAYERIVEGLESMEEKAEEIELGGKIIVEVYVDGDAEIIGRVYKFVSDDGEDFTVKIGHATKGSKRGFEASFKRGEYVVKFAGTGKLKGNKVTGEYVLKVNGEKYFAVNVEKLDLGALVDGYVKGHFTCEFDGNMGMITSLLPRQIRRNVSNFSDMDMKLGLDLNIDTSAKKHNIDLGVLKDGEELFRIAFKGTVKSASKVKIPGKAVDVTESSDLQSFLGDLSWDSLLDKLEDADVPKEYRDMMKEIMD